MSWRVNNHLGLSCLAANLSQNWVSVECLFTEKQCTVSENYTSVMFCLNRALLSRVSALKPLSSANKSSPGSSVAYSVSESDRSKFITGTSTPSSEQKSISSSVKHFRTRDLSIIDCEKRHQISLLTARSSVVKVQVVVHNWRISCFFGRFLGEKGALEYSATKKNNHNCSGCLSAWKLLFKDLILLELHTRCFCVFHLKLRSNNFLQLPELKSV